MRSNLGSIFTAAFILPVILLSLSGLVSASTSAELQKDLLQTKKEIPSGGRWEIRMATQGRLISAKSLLNWTLYPVGVDANYGEKSDKFRKNTKEFLALVQDAVSSGETSLVEYKDEYNKDEGYCINADHKYIYVEMVIWDFKTEGKAQQFMSVINRLSTEAMIYSEKKGRELKKRIDAMNAERAKMVGTSKRFGTRHVTTAEVQGYGHKYNKTSVNVGDEDASYEKSEAYAHYQGITADWKFVSYKKAGQSIGDRTFVSCIRKGSRVLVVWGASSYFEARNKRVVNQWADGKRIREEYVFIPAPPYPQGDVTSIIRAAYNKMAHESPASDPRNVIIQIFMPKTDYLKACKQTVFGPAFPDFKTAIVEGAVSWETVFHEGTVTDAPIYITLFHKGKLAKRVKSKVDDLGYYKFSFGVNKKGKRDVVKFEENISRELFRPTSLMHDSWVVPPSSVKPVNIKVPLSPYKKKIQKMLQKSPPSYLLMFENVAYMIAMKNDVAHQMKTFSKKTPNLDKFWKNTKTPDGVLANALMVLGEVYTSKDSALSAAKNADDHLKDFRKYLKSKGCKIFPDAGIGKPKSGIQLWLKNIGMTDYYILNADK